MRMAAESPNWPAGGRKNGVSSAHPLIYVGGVMSPVDQPARFQNQLYWVERVNQNVVQEQSPIQSLLILTLHKLRLYNIETLN